MEIKEDKDVDLEFDKAVGQFRLALGIVMKPLMRYGQQDYVGTAIDEITSLAIQLHWRLSGLTDIPFGKESSYHVNTDKLHW